MTHKSTTIEEIRKICQYIKLALTLGNVGGNVWDAKHRSGCDTKSQQLDALSAINVTLLVFDLKKVIDTTQAKRVSSLFEQRINV